MNLNQSSSINTSAVLNYSNVTPPIPSASITVNRNRLKLYGSNVYLKNETCFEIELWNPKSTRVLAKISINGNNISGGGIVVNPGQRVYLERFLNEDRKFKYVTYEAENSQEGRKAIQNNGDIVVSFYDEVIVFNSITNWNYGNGSIVTDTIEPSTVTQSTPSFKTNTGGVTTSNRRMSLSKSITTQALFSDTIETGRVEKGEQSNQQLISTTGDFSFLACATYQIKILPESQKPVEIGEIRSYCTGCGRRYRTGENFCSTCGTAKNN